MASMTSSNIGGLQPEVFKWAHFPQKKGNLFVLIAQVDVPQWNFSFLLQCYTLILTLAISED